MYKNEIASDTHWVPAIVVKERETERERGERERERERKKEVS